MILRYQLQVYLHSIFINMDFPTVESVYLFIFSLMPLNTEIDYIIFDKKENLVIDYLRKNHA